MQYHFPLEIILPVRQNKPGPCTSPAPSRTCVDEVSTLVQLEGPFLSLFNFFLRSCKFSLVLVACVIVSIKRFSVLCYLLFIGHVSQARMIPKKERKHKVIH